METNIWFILTYGSIRAPADWVQNYKINMQKLYYIKGGTAWYTDKRGARQRFIPGMIYLFPYNFEYRFENDRNDPLDHIFFDFLSSPPLIADSPLIYEPREDHGLLTLFRAFEEFCFSTPDLEGRRKRFKLQDIMNAGRGSVEEKKRIVHRMLLAMLDLLSYNVELPFVDDRMVCETLDMIRENYTQPIKVTDMAARSGYEVNYFIKRFRSIMNQTPYAYLRAYRIMNAYQLISSGETLESAAAKSGYSDGASLSHAMRAFDTRRW